MKTRERLKRITEAKSWPDKNWLANDATPGTALDMQIMAVCQEYETRKDDPVPGGDAITDLGVELAKAVRFGNSALFRQWADAIDAHKKHVPCPDKFRAAIIRYCSGVRSYSIKEIIHHLRTKGLIPDALRESTGLGDYRRKVRRICTESGITIRGTSGRPKKPGREQGKQAS